jgi:hypothetical protein
MEVRKTLNIGVGNYLFTKKNIGLGSQQIPCVMPTCLSLSYAPHLQAMLVYRGCRMVESLLQHSSRFHQQEKAM